MTTHTWTAPTPPAIARMCTNKRRYTSWAAAMHVGKKIAEQQGHPMRVYRCDNYDGWHLTSKVRGEK